MYYIVSGGQVVESQYSEPSQADLQEWANMYSEHVYVISGEHYGMTADPVEQPDVTDQLMQIADEFMSDLCGTPAGAGGEVG